MWGRLLTSGGLTTRIFWYQKHLIGPAAGRLTIGRRLTTCPTTWYYRSCSTLAVSCPVRRSTFQRAFSSVYCAS